MTIVGTTTNLKSTLSNLLVKLSGATIILFTNFFYNKMLKFNSKKEKDACLLVKLAGAKMMMSVIAISLVFTACGDKKNDGVNNPGGNGSGGSVKIGNVTWATCNVDDFQTFAARPDMLTKFYQWNREKAWATTGSVSGWNSTPDQSSTWTINPCPAGWRLPTSAEFQALDSVSDGYSTIVGVGFINGKGGTWANANTRGNAVAGRFYGVNHATATLPNNMAGAIFLPAGESRFPSGMLNTGNLAGDGCYWSSRQRDSIRGRHIKFDSAGSYLDSNRSESKAYGFCLRCVKDN